MRIGNLNRYVRIEQVTTTKDDDYGSRVKSWAEYKTVWANVRDITGRNQEQTNSDVRLMKRPCEVTIRYDGGVDSTMRIVMLDRDDRILNIVSQPAEIGNRDGLVFMAEDYDE